MMKKIKSKNKGYSFLELTVAITIIAAIAGFAIPNYLNIRETFIAAAQVPILLSLYEAQLSRRRDEGNFADGTFEGNQFNPGPLKDYLDPPNLSTQKKKDAYYRYFGKHDLNEPVTVGVQKQPCPGGGGEDLDYVVDVKRKTGSGDILYTLFVTPKGELLCDPPNCNTTICQKIGYAKY